MKIFQFLACAAFMSATQKCPADEPDACKIGQAVLAIQKAIANPENPGSLDAVKELGLKTAYYPMVRGWLAQELGGAESIKSGQKPGSANPELDARIIFLKKAIRAIDLE